MADISVSQKALKIISNIEKTDGQKGISSAQERDLLAEALRNGEINGGNNIKYAENLINKFDLKEAEGEASKDVINVIKKAMSMDGDKKAIDSEREAAVLDSIIDNTTGQYSSEDIKYAKAMKKSFGLSESTPLQEANNKNNALETQNSDLTAKNERLEVENERLEVKNERLEVENKALLKELELQQGELQEMERVLEEQLSQIGEKNTALKEEISKLKKEIEMYKKQCKGLEDKIMDIYKHNDNPKADKTMPAPKEKEAPKPDDKSFFERPIRQQKTPKPHITPENKPNIKQHRDTFDMIKQGYRNLYNRLFQDE